jgi:hypothetical protein
MDAMNTAARKIAKVVFMKIPPCLFSPERAARHAALSTIVTQVFRRTSESLIHKTHSLQVSCNKAALSVLLPKENHR